MASTTIGYFSTRKQYRLKARRQVDVLVPSLECNLHDHSFRDKECLTRNTQLIEQNNMVTQRRNVATLSTMPVVRLHIKIVMHPNQ